MQIILECIYEKVEQKEGEMESNMFGIDKKTTWLMQWADRMSTKYGQPQSGYDWCRKLAYAMGEQGQDSPSEDAIARAKIWEEIPPEG